MRVTWDHQDTPQQRARELTLLPKQGGGVTFNPTADFPHALLRLLNQACSVTEWGLDFGWADVGAEGAGDVLPGDKVMVH